MPGIDQAPGAFFRLLFDSFSERLLLDAAEFPDSLGPVRLSASQHCSASGTGDGLKISLWSDTLCAVLCIIKMMFFQSTVMTHGAIFIYINLESKTHQAIQNLLSCMTMFVSAPAALTCALQSRSVAPALLCQH